MIFYRWIVEHPVAVWMVTLATFVFGLVSYAQLPLNLMPDISYPTLTIRTEYAGAAPEEVESQVSRPIEEALSTTEGLVEIESRSRAGMSDVVLEFDWGTSMSAATQDVRERIQTTQLPDGVERPLILRYDPSLDPILRVALSAGEKTTLLELREYAEKQLKRDLETAEGVAAVAVRGGQERRILIEPREDWLAARGVTLDQLTNALNSENVNLAGGIVREGENEYLIRTLNELTTIDDVRSLRVLRADGSSVAVRDVAEVRAGAAEQEVVARLDGGEAVELEVYKEADANIVQVARAVKAELEEAKLEGGLTVKILDDQANFIERALENLFDDAVLGGILAILVTFVFLRDWVTTGIISTAIPICLVVTFAVMYTGGTSLNLMSLGGLALGVSMVIDSGTVVLENIQNHIDRGMGRREAAVRGTSEVSTAVFASVLTGMAVFFPIVFVEGIAGQIFGDLALTVVFSLLASLAVALLFIPMLGAREMVTTEVAGRPPLPPLTDLRDAWQTLRAPRRIWAWPYALLRFVIHGFVAGFFSLFAAMAAAFGWLLLRGVGFVFRQFNRVTVWLADQFLRAYGVAEGWFARVLDRALRFPTLVLVGGALAFVLSLGLFQSVGAELIPEVHQGRFTVSVALPVGTPLNKTDAVVAQVERELGALDGVASIYAVVGTERRADSRGDEGENTARVLVEMTPGGDLEAREDALISRIRAILDGYPQMTARFDRPALFSFRTPIEVVVYSTELASLRAASTGALAALSDVDGLADLRSSLGAGYPEVQIQYDRERLAMMNLGVGDVARAVRNKVQGADAAKLAEGDRRVDMLVRLAETDRDSLEQLASVNVNPRLIPAVRLDTVAHLVEAEGPSEIRRIDQRRAIVLSANLTGFDLSGTGEAVADALASADLPPGAEFEVAGQNRELSRSIGSLQLALALAIFLVYVIMASTFESIRDPFVILFSVPLALVGVAVGLFVTDTPVSVVVFIGMIVLAGVVVANAIVLVDAINQMRTAGEPLEEAIRKAAAQRLRPILITALNSVLGLAPLALGFGEGQEMQRPLAITIIFGLASSTFLTLVVVPCVYRIVARIGR